MKRSRPIPQAILCDPPESTEMDASDLASGMLGTIISEISGASWLVSTASVVITNGGYIEGDIGRFTMIGLTHLPETVETVRQVAGDTPVDLMTPEWW